MIMKLNIQRFAQAQITFTMAFDEHIKKVTTDNTNDVTINSFKGYETAPTGDLLTWLQANGTKQ